MGNKVSETHPDRHMINSILEKKRLALNGYEVEALYSHFNNVISRFIHSGNGVIKYKVDVTCAITQYKKIAYYYGPVTAFRVGDDPVPYILFKHNNYLYHSAKSLVKRRYKNRELPVQDGVLVIGLISASGLYSDGQFYWVLDVIQKI